MPVFIPAPPDGDESRCPLEEQIKTMNTKNIGQTFSLRLPHSLAFFQAE